MRIFGLLYLLQVKRKAMPSLTTEKCEDDIGNHNCKLLQFTVYIGSTVVLKIMIICLLCYVDFVIFTC